MIACTDSPDYARTMLGPDVNWRQIRATSLEHALAMLAGQLYHTTELETGEVGSIESWRYLFLTEKSSTSQYDAVVDLCQMNVGLPDSLLCLAGSGERHHGLRGRQWAALPGNIHLTAHMTPNQKTSVLGIGLTLISALAVTSTIDSLPGLKGRAMIKWVNDICIDEAKVAGFLTHSMCQQDMVTNAVVGIGLNVETTPTLPADKFVYRTTSLREHVANPNLCSQQIVFVRLADNLRQQYNRLITGELAAMLDEYRERSMIIGKKVEVLPDSPHDTHQPVAGTVESIGDNLELNLLGYDRPITRGRLVLIR
jgi:biotin-[acetyl-CoA-carboxylase] ligase BirA-like protein